MEMVGVGDVTAWVSAPCVDMTIKVSAAAVYSEFNVAAGWGVGAVKGPQARIAPSVTVRIKIYL
jgi:hypothetical protein